MSRTIPLTLPLLVSWSIVGCAVDEENVALVGQYGLSPQGTSLNGLSPQGLSPQGSSLNGIGPNGLSPQGTPIGVAVTGTPLSGPGVVGSTWTGHLADSTTVNLRVDEAMQGTGANSDVWSYRISFFVNNAWQPLCLDHSGSPIFADTVSGTWNLSQGVSGGGAYHPESPDFTIACRGSAIAKCLEFGYKPWHSATRELAACVRAMRADYCGDGTPYTVDGTIVNFVDDAGIVPDGIAWEPEAEWTPDGALCVSKKKATRFDQVADLTPSCYPHALKPEKSCGTTFSAGAALITELAPQ